MKTPWPLRPLAGCSARLIPALTGPGDPPRALSLRGMYMLAAAGYELATAAAPSV